MTRVLYGDTCALDRAEAHYGLVHHVRDDASLETFLKAGHDTHSLFMQRARKA